MGSRWARPYLIPISEWYHWPNFFFQWTSQFSSWWDWLKVPKSDTIIRLIPFSVIPLSGAHCNWSKITMTSKICWFSAAVLISGSLAPRALHWFEAWSQVIWSFRKNPQTQVPLLLLKVWVVHLTVDNNKYKE